MQRHRDAANRAAILKKVHRVRDKHSSLWFIPARVERHAEPTRQPVQNLFRRAAHIQQYLHGGYLVFQSGVETFDVGEKAIEEGGRLLIFTIDAGQVVGEIRETRVISAQRAQSRSRTFIAAKANPQLQVAALRALK